VKPRDAVALTRETFSEWRRDDALTLGAALAYYTTFSLAPLLVVVIAIAGLVFGREAVEGRLVGEIQGLVGRQGAEAVQTMIASAGRHEEAGLVAAVLAVLVTLFGATGVFAQLQASLDRIWNVPPPERAVGIKAMLKVRALSFGMVLAVGFLLLVSLVLSAALAALDDYAGGVLPVFPPLLQALNFAVSFSLITLLFALIFKILPDVDVAWRDVWTGAALTALLFTVGKLLIGLYIGESGVASAYGAAGSLVVVLLWVFYSAQILFFGAEFTQVYARRRGSMQKRKGAPRGAPLDERRLPASG
jgi:membrane protein